MPCSGLNLRFGLGFLPIDLIIPSTNARFKMNVDHRRGLFFDDPIFCWFSHDWMIRKTELGLLMSRSLGREAGGLVPVAPARIFKQTNQNHEPHKEKWVHLD